MSKAADETETPGWVKGFETLNHAELQRLQKALFDRVREKIQDMAARGRLGFGPDWQEIHAMYCADFTVRAAAIYKNALRVLPAADDAWTVNDVLAIVGRHVDDEFHQNTKTATDTFKRRPGNTTPTWYLPKLVHEATTAKNEMLQLLQIDLMAMKQESQRSQGQSRPSSPTDSAPIAPASHEKPEKDPHWLAKVLIGAVVTAAVSAVLLVWQKTTFDPAQEQRQSRAKQRDELIRILSPKLDAVMEAADSLDDLLVPAHPGAKRAEFRIKYNAFVARLRSLDSSRTTVEAQMQVAFDVAVGNRYSYTLWQLRRVDTLTKQYLEGYDAFYAPRDSFGRPLPARRVPIMSPLMARDSADIAIFRLGSQVPALQRVLVEYRDR